ncbi:MAG TPA: PocR ligand-binding domain-containing protein, partial [Desulfobacterales bacterium]|nr:PocR ligand-binding domain-containing protein [Desulfobacterales bacterium]
EESDRYGGKKALQLESYKIFSCLNAGLLDSAAPVIVGDYHLGNVLCGQVLEKPIKADVAVQRARAIGITDIEGYLSALEEIPIMSRDRLRIIVNLMEMITNTISELALEKHISYKNSQRYLNKLINSVYDCIISTDANGAISMINKAGIGMFGNEAKKLVGRSMFSLFSDPASIEACKRNVDLRLIGKSHNEMRAINKDGKEIPVQVSLSKIYDESREHSGYVAVLRDISEEKKIERMKEDLIGMLTHDMGNPILSIQKAIKLLIDGRLGPLNKNQTDIMSLSLGTSHQLLGMVTDLLDIYRSENDKFMLHKILIDMNQILEESIKQVNFLVEDKRVTVCFEPSAPSLKLQGDRNRLMRVCINLLDNAIKYSPDNGELRISSTIIRGDGEEKVRTVVDPLYDRHIKSGKQYFLVTVMDQGLGIPKQYQQNVFDKFFMIGSGNESGRKGLGLGLSFCKQVIESHEGIIWVQSPFTDDNGRERQGCRFSFILPLSPSKQAEQIVEHT